MQATDDFRFVTTDAAVEIYTASTPVFEGVLREVRELSKKKPDATMNPSKVKLVNRVLKDLLVILKDEPAGKYLEELDDDKLPQVSDAVLTMVQFESALKAFRARYLVYLTDFGESHWITKEILAYWRNE
ncbi:hypothetical protein [Rhizobium sp. Nf11,1]|uniref:hypothetical protein n=1 Tax=Rhizobium sp. Nf11,1 TaxID=3404923 RepID=UPI003D354D23